jgi:hypothetical protein
MHRDFKKVISGSQIFIGKIGIVRAQERNGVYSIDFGTTGKPSTGFKFMPSEVVSTDSCPVRCWMCDDYREEFVGFNDLRGRCAFSHTYFDEEFKSMPLTNEEPRMFCKYHSESGVK